MEGTLDIDLSWINTDTLKSSIPVPNKELPNSLLLLAVSLWNLFETNKELFIQFEAKIEQNDVSFTAEKALESPYISITEALMARSTECPKQKAWLHCGNIWQHDNFIKFFQHKFEVFGIALDDYT